MGFLSRMSYPRSIGLRRLILGLFIFVATLWAANRLWPLPLEKYDDKSFVVLDTKGEILHVHLTSDDKWRLPVTLEEVNPTFLDMLITFEDQRFYKHLGIDPMAAFRAVGQLISSGKIISGGSTLTMQCAKLLNPKPRTFLHKIKECFRAVQLECRFSKKQILEMYLTLAPYGHNVEGIRAASLFYFGKEPRHLTLTEAALLVALPQNPTRFRPDKNPEIARKNRNKVLLRYQENRGVLSDHDLEEALKEPVPSVPHTFPRLAFHASYLLKKKWQTSTHTKNPCATHIHKDLQLQLEAIVGMEEAMLPPHQALSVIVVHNPTRRVHAYIGSANPLSQQNKGYVDMIQAVRSPGSTLKPFIYGLGLSEGWLKPETQLLDHPKNFSGYAPVNFMDTFHGPITVAKALQQSLNIPVVTVLDRLGPGHFMNHLKSLGVTLHTPSKILAPSLAIALGGVGMRLWDLIALYTALANKGVYAPLQLIAEDTHVMGGEQKLMAPNAAHALLTILRGAPPPPGYAPKSADGVSSIAFKTGTSYGHRDAVCVGFSDTYTVGVWTGRADGTPVSGQVGRSHAAPFLFKIFTVLEPNALQPVPESTSNARSIPINFNDKNTFTLTFPMESTVLLRTPGEPIMLTLQGGKPPYTFYLNGRPFALNTKTPIIPWIPEEDGFFDISVIDAMGTTTVRHVRLSSTLF